MSGRYQFMSDTDLQKCQIPFELSGQRLDKAVAGLFPEHSRGRLQAWIRDGDLLLDGEKVVCKQKVRGGEWVSLDAVVEDISEDFAPESMQLDIIHTDEHLVILNKPAGLVVHPAAGNWSGTLLNGLLFQFPELAGIPRAGIVHRLDKDTSGIMMVARSLSAHTRLVEALQAREIKREYVALAEGSFVAGGTVDAPIGRHPVDRKRMAVVLSGKEAVTHYRVAERFQGFTLLDVSLETGRTHQIRVHMAHIKHALVGDPVYAGRLRIPKGASDTVAQAIRGFPRQALHARRLTLEHPGSGELLSWEAPIPDDFADLLARLEKESTDG